MKNRSAGLPAKEIKDLIKNMMEQSAHTQKGETI